MYVCFCLHVCGGEKYICKNTLVYTLGSAPVCFYGCISQIVEIIAGFQT